MCLTSLFQRREVISKIYVRLLLSTGIISGYGLYSLHNAHPLDLLRALKKHTCFFRSAHALLFSLGLPVTTLFLVLNVPCDHRNKLWASLNTKFYSQPYIYGISRRQAHISIVYQNLWLPASDRLATCYLLHATLNNRISTVYQLCIVLREHIYLSYIKFCWLQASGSWLLPSCYSLRATFFRLLHSGFSLI